jgi:hypothetical protein
MKQTVDLLSNHSPEQQFLSESTQYELIQPETPIDDTIANPALTGTQVLSIGLLGVGVIGMALLLRVIALKLSTEHKQVIETLKYTDKVPCRNCQFFSNNSYLKCAVHPSTVLKDTAIDCSDYCPKTSNTTKDRDNGDF